jgi:chemotaxis protein methyltransferase CheR
VCDSNNQIIESVKHKRKRNTLKDRIELRKKEILREELEGKKRISLQERIDLRKKINRGEIPSSDDRSPQSTDAIPELESTGNSYSENIQRQKLNRKRVPLIRRIKTRKEDLVRSLGKNSVYRRLKKQKSYDPFGDTDTIPHIQSELLRNGAQIEGFRERYFKQVLNQRINKLHMKSYSEYLSFVLENNQKEPKILESMLSINVTSFYRDRDTWKFFQKILFPNLVEHQKGQRLRIWSAGCAMGAEPYSISILCSEMSKDLNIKDIPIEIIATDINEELLKMANEGIYQKQQLVELDEQQIRAYFQSNDADFLVHPAIKQSVKFSRLDLVTDDFPSGFDLILCRNVLIYIEPTVRKQIYKKFFKSLKKGGFLVLGKSEGILDLSEYDNVIKYSSVNRIYQKL